MHKLVEERSETEVDVLVGKRQMIKVIDSNVAGHLSSCCNVTVILGYVYVKLNRPKS
jgi:hypothetical protein